MAKPKKTTNNEYKIAVLLPTRARTAALRLSVISIMNRVLDINSVQLLFGFDNDDEIGLKYSAVARRKRRPLQCRTICPNGL